MDIPNSGKGGDGDDGEKEGADFTVIIKEESLYDLDPNLLFQL